MSKQVNRVKIEPETSHGNWSSYWKCNSFVNPSTCKTGDIISHSNADHTYTMQELVKEVTLDLQFCMELNLLPRGCTQL